MPLEKSQIFHIVGEIVVIVGMFVYFQIKLSSASTKVGQLERIIQEQNKKIRILDAVLQEVVKVMPAQVRNGISQKVQMVSNSPQTSSAPPPPPPPAAPAPRQPENPLSSVMNMIAPMMSSMMVAGMSGDDEPPGRVVVEEAASDTSEISDADIADELKELDDEEEVGKDPEARSDDVEEDGEDVAQNAEETPSDHEADLE